MANKRSVIVIGVSGSGKSTVCNKIIGDNLFEVVQGFATGTQVINCKRKEVECAQKKLEITLVDTIGLFDAHKITKDSVSKIKNAIEDVGGLNLVLFVIKFDRLTDAEVAMMKIIDENFKILGVGKLSAAIITACELMDAAKRSEAITSFQKDNITKAFASYMEKGIYTVGFPDTSNMHEDFIPIMDSKMKTDTQKLLKLVEDAEEHYTYDEMVRLGCIEYIFNTWRKILKYFTSKESSESN